MCLCLKELELQTEPGVPASAAAGIFEPLVRESPLARGRAGIPSRLHSTCDNWKSSIVNHPRPSVAESTSAAPAFRHFASYFEMTPTPDESAGVRRHGHISQRGPSVVRGVLVEAAHVVIRRCRLLLG